MNCRVLRVILSIIYINLDLNAYAQVSDLQFEQVVTRWKKLEKEGARFVPRDSFAAATLNGRIWLTGGYTAPYYTKNIIYSTARSDVWVSDDGSSWTQILQEAPWRRRYGHTLTTFSKPTLDGVDEFLILMGGFSPEPSNDVWVTRDGKSWKNITEKARWPSRAWHCSVAYGNKIFVLGGSPLSNDVWYSESGDKDDWKSMGNAGWSPRAGHGCATQYLIRNQTIGSTSGENLLYVVGGWNGNPLNDVWRMDTSGKWEMLTEAASFSPRGWHSFVSLHSGLHGDYTIGTKLYVIGGGRIGDGVNVMHTLSDVWTSRDGVEWIQANSDFDGVSTAEWCLIEVKGKELCHGKWGHSVVKFERPVQKVYFCNETCKTNDFKFDIGKKVITLANIKLKPPPPRRANVLNGTEVISTILYEDGCGICNLTRYYLGEKVSSLVFIGGDTSGALRSDEVFHSDDGILCEKNGEICSRAGVCTIGAGCSCIRGKEGEFCEKASDIVILDSVSCFPSEAIVYLPGGRATSIDQISIGDSILSVDEDGQVQYSKVYYIPHDPSLSKYRYQRIEYNSTWANGVLEVTDDHLIYANNGYDTELADHPLLSEARQIPAKEASLGMKLFIAVEDKVIEATITDISATYKKGAHTLYTMNGKMIVNGVLCSNFGDFYPQIMDFNRDFLAFSYFSVHRLIYQALSFPEISYFLRTLDRTVILPILYLIFL